MSVLAAGLEMHRAVHCCASPPVPLRPWLSLFPRRSGNHAGVAETASQARYRPCRRPGHRPSTRYRPGLAHRCFAGHANSRLRENETGRRISRAGKEKGKLVGTASSGNHRRRGPQDTERCSAPVRITGPSHRSARFAQRGTGLHSEVPHTGTAPLCRPRVKKKARRSIA